MYQNIYYDNYKKKVHIWDDRKGHVVLPYKHYAYIKDRNGRDVSCSKKTKYVNMFP